MSEAQYLENKKDTAMPDPAGYHLEIALATLEKRWRDCASTACRRRKRCTGGPRGTFSRHGKPACNLPAPVTMETIRNRPPADLSWAFPDDDALPPIPPVQSP